MRIENLQQVIRLKIDATLDSMTLRGILHKYEFQLSQDKYLQQVFNKRIEYLEEFKKDSFLMTEMITNLRDDYEGMMENPKPLPEPKPISQKYETEEEGFKNVRRLPQRNKVEIEILDINTKGTLLKEVEYETIRRVLEETNSNQQAADVLGISVRGLTVKLSNYEMRQGIQTRYQIEKKHLQDVVLEKPKANAEANDKPIKKVQRPFYEAVRNLASCEHHWKTDWLDSGLCMNCFKEKRLKDKLEKNIH